MYVHELTRRRYKAKQAIRSPNDVMALPAIRRLRSQKREHFVVLLLNARHELEGIETISVGILNASIVHPREVFMPAIREAAASLILIHNHPSGDPAPSEEDLAITKRLMAVGELLGIEVLDHLIVTKRGAMSFKLDKHI